ncbi:MAG: hypothetical protein MHMPM18_000346 [Marteilia pararefringens]
MQFGLKSSETCRSSIDQLDRQIEFAKTQITKLAFDNSRQQNNQPNCTSTTKWTETLDLRFFGTIMESKDLKDNHKDALNRTGASRFTLDYRGPSLEAERLGTHRSSNICCSIRVTDEQRRIILVSNQLDPQFWKELRPGNLISISGRYLLIDGMDESTGKFLVKEGFMEREELAEYEDQWRRKFQDDSILSTTKVKCERNKFFKDEDVLIFDAILKGESSMNQDSQRRFKICVIDFV